MALRSRTPWLWVLFAVAAALAGYAVHRLYRTAQQEIAGQSERAVLQARARAEDRIRAFVDETRRAIITDLAGFHEDGLTASLDRWDAANDRVAGTFLWDATRGFALGPDWSKPGAGREEITGLWREFRAWRAEHLDLVRRDSARIGLTQVMALRTLDNPAFPAAALRYQAENLDMLVDARQVVDPWAGWAAREDVPAAHWIIWYQAGPNAGVRGCFVSVHHLVDSLAGGLGREISGGEFARVSLYPVGRDPEPVGSGGSMAALPGYVLRVEPGDLFLGKAAAARLDALIAAALLGLFLLGGAALTLYTRREAREAGRKITFVTQVSHELRTPLTSIRMFADMLAAGEVSAEKRLKFARTISTESGRLGELIERLLAFSALEKGTRQVALAPVDVTGLVREVTEETAARLDEAGLQVALDLPPALRAQADRSIVKQALLNLVDNACKYAATGKMLAIAARPDGPRVVVQVADAGPGIPAEVRGRLFEPFVQGGTTLTTKSPGVGLGLSLARGLLRQAQGDLVFVASPRGAVFEIRLPATPAP